MKTIEELNMNVDLAHRYLNEGFSGGRNVMRYLDENVKT